MANRDTAQQKPGGVVWASVDSVLVPQSAAGDAWWLGGGDGGLFGPAAAVPTPNALASAVGGINSAGRSWVRPAG